MKQITTLAIIATDDKVLLGMKKRGFGMGRWNGFGGKVKSPETIEETARRELYEEAGITALTLSKQALLQFRIEQDDMDIDVHVFRVDAFAGEPQETEEMRPQWFTHTEIPFHDMWPDDKHWLPRFLAGERLHGVFHFKDQDTLADFELKELAE